VGGGRRKGRESEMEGEWRGRETAARPRRVGSGELFCWLLGQEIAVLPRCLLLFVGLGEETGDCRLVRRRRRPWMAGSRDFPDFL
jgi:hypothetical protein